jgi:hypothetical protein
MSRGFPLWVLCGQLGQDRFDQVDHTKKSVGVDLSGVRQGVPCREGRHHPGGNLESKPGGPDDRDQAMPPPCPTGHRKFTAVQRVEGIIDRGS